MPGRFPATPGNLTRLLRDDYLAAHPGVPRLPQTLSFQASWDPQAPLYFWQLYSLLGRQRLERLLHAFYSRVLADAEAPWFRDVFAEFGGVEYHTRGQLRFWLDAFAGGERYRGGLAALEAHHGMAAEIMTERGARRWMHHMRLATGALRGEWDALDPRIAPCLDDFLAFAMERYGVQFDFHVAPWIHSLHHPARL